MAGNIYEKLAAWYLRFNGYFMVTNFTVHPDYKNKPGGTDADILAVRFPYSREAPLGFEFNNDDNLIKNDRIDFLIGEVKAGQCALNDSWKNRSRGNIEYALRWMGFAPQDAIDGLANDIYATGGTERIAGVSCRLIFFGARNDDLLNAEMPNSVQRIYDSIIDFLSQRFRTGCWKPTRVLWDEEIKEFAEKCQNNDRKALQKWISDKLGRFQEER